MQYNGKDADGQPCNHGQIQAEQSAEAFAKAGYKVFIQTPQTKDFNEDLLTFREMLTAVAVVLALAHGERVCREISDFLAQY